MNRSFDCPKCGCPVQVWKQPVGDPHAHYLYTERPMFSDWERVVVCSNCGEELYVMFTAKENK